jgi:hypothetical protein
MANLLANQLFVRQMRAIDGTNNELQTLQEFSDFLKFSRQHLGTEL